MEQIWCFVMALQRSLGEFISDKNPIYKIQSDIRVIAS